MSSENIFGQRIFELRKAAGMTQKQLGESVGLSMQAINDIEKGRRETTITKAILMARLFNTTIHYLVGDTDNPARPENTPFVEYLFDPENYSPFASRLGDLHESTGVSWEKIAEILESGKTNPETEIALSPLLALADFFDVSLDYLVGRSDDPKRR